MGKQTVFLLTSIFFAIWLFGLVYFIDYDNNSDSKVPIQKIQTIRSNQNEPPKSPILLIVLGNEPLDDSTPTIDTMKRVETAVIKYRETPESTYLLFTGGPTAGNSTEAKVMGNYAQQLGVDPLKMILEEQARSTAENAHYSILLLHHIQFPFPKEVFIVSKPDHLKWAIPLFIKEGEKLRNSEKHTISPSSSTIPSIYSTNNIFLHAKPLPSSVSKKEVIEQMEEYIRKFKDLSSWEIKRRGVRPNRIAWRLENIKKGIQGID